MLWQKADCFVSTHMFPWCVSVLCWFPELVVTVPRILNPKLLNSQQPTAAILMMTIGEELRVQGFDLPSSARSWRALHPLHHLWWATTTGATSPSITWRRGSRILAWFVSLARVQLLPPGHPTALLVHVAMDFDDFTWMAKVQQLCSELNICSLVDSQVVTPEFLFQAVHDRATAKQGLQLYKKTVVKPPLLDLDKHNFHKSAGKCLSSLGLAYIDLCPDMNLQGWTFDTRLELCQDLDICSVHWSLAAIIIILCWEFYLTFSSLSWVWVPQSLCWSCVEILPMYCSLSHWLRFGYFHFWWNPFPFLPWTVCWDGEGQIRRKRYPIHLPWIFGTNVGKPGRVAAA